MTLPSAILRAARAAALPVLCAVVLSAAAQSSRATADDGVPAVTAAAATADPEPLRARRRTHDHRRAQPMTRGVDEHVRALLPYAALANEVYCNAVYERQGSSGAAAPADADCGQDGAAQRHGWNWLESYPNGRLGPDDYRGMRFAVYYRDHGLTQPVEIGVGFRGTDFRSPADWHSNLRWFVPGRDQYDVLAEVVADVIRSSKASVQEVLKRRVDDWHIVATGHSLGGGLAQLFAYKSAEVRGAIAFDPSPVTGFHSCVRDAEVNCNVPVWRVYEEGEVLAYVRAFTRLFYPLSENITELEFNLLGGNIIANHSMPRFLDSLQQHTQKLPLAVQGTRADLFASNPDCDCSRTRRPVLYAAVQEWCEQRMARRQESAPATWGEFGPTLAPAVALSTARTTPANGVSVRAQATNSGPTQDRTQIP